MPAAHPEDFLFADTGIDEPAIFYCTSGSTGLPKSVTHAAGDLLLVWRGVRVARSRARRSDRAAGLLQVVMRGRGRAPEG